MARRARREEKSRGKGAPQAPQGAQGPIGSNGFWNVSKKSKTKVRLDLGHFLHLAVLNIQGMMRQEERPEIEEWMRKNRVWFMGLTETHIPNNQQERKNILHIVFYWN